MTPGSFIYGFVVDSISLRSATTTFLPILAVTLFSNIIAVMLQLVKSRHERKVVAYSYRGMYICLVRCILKLWVTEIYIIMCHQPLHYHFMVTFSAIHEKEQLLLGCLKHDKCIQSLLQVARWFIYLELDWNKNWSTWYIRLPQVYTDILRLLGTCSVCVYCAFLVMSHSSASGAYCDFIDLINIMAWRSLLILQ